MTTGPTPDRQVGHYRIRSPLGAGGMGVVYEAEDVRLGRRVAIKFVSPERAGSPDALARFLREGRAAAALSHPNICAVLDVGDDDGRPFLVMERLEGRTLKDAIAETPFPVGAVLELGAQMADALEAAHSKGIVHRDIKPSNVFLTRRGDVKLLDFGLARLVAEEENASVADGTTDTGAPSRPTGQGLAVGTVSYMSPEQARGEELDRRTDVFSLGTVLYEMTTGRRAFPGRSSVEVGAGALGRDPTRVDRDRPEAAVLQPIIEKALEKDRTLRYQTAGDLRADLRRAQRILPSPQTPAAWSPGRAKRAWRWMAIAALMVAALLAGRQWAPRLEAARFTQLTFRRGIVTSARFTADGETVVYSALWDGGPPRVFSRRLDSAAPTSLGLPPALLLSASSRGDLAVLLAPQGERGVVWLGTLARAPLSGGPLRRLLDDVYDADWSPDGRELAVIRWHTGAFQLEYPIGTVLLRPCARDHLRVSPRGDRVALLDQSGIILVDRGGRRITLPVPPAHQRLAWWPDGRSLIVDAGETDADRALRRVGLDGRDRVVCALAGTLAVHDVSRGGRVLIHHGIEHWGVRARAPGETEEHDASVYLNAGVAGLSADGAQILLWDGSQGPPGSAMLRPTVGGEAVRLGDGHAHGLSADSKWVAVETLSQGRWRLLLVPTTSGEVVPVNATPFEPLARVWLVDAQHVGFDGAEPGRPARSFLAKARGAVRPVTPEGSLVIPGLLPNHDVLARASDGSISSYSLDGEKRKTLGWKLPTQPDVEALRTSGDGRFVYVRTGSVPARIDRVATGTGESTRWRSLAPSDPTGTGHVWSIFMTPDGLGYAYTHGLFLQDLFVVDGLR